jgi:mannose-1-phosphate guanylyltransferase
MTEHTYAVIMAGGGGTRLWPVSRKERPKQLLPLIGQETLFQTTIARLENLFAPQNILVVMPAGACSNRFLRQQLYY